jgi:hypothetical protein
MTNHDPFRNYDAWKTASPHDDDPEEDNSDFEEMFSDYDSLYQLYRQVYKATPCGPSIGAGIYTEWPPEPNLDESGPGGSNAFGTSETRWFYCDDLLQLGTYKDMRENGLLIMELSVGSIVEGVDYDCDTIHVEWKPLEIEPEDLKEQFWQAVTDVNKQADQIWQRTHGCSGCFDLWKLEHDGFVPVDGNPEFDACYEKADTIDDLIGQLPVHESCQVCMGEGIPI